MLMPPQGQDDEVTCPCGQNIEGEWIGCDMHEKCKVEWFHMQCVNLEKPPGDDELWFCDDCKKTYKTEIAKMMEDNKKHKK